MLKKILSKIDAYLFVIVGIAVLLRFANIGSMPPSLNWDEVSHGYNAYSIMTTGKDEWGVTLPTIFRAYGDYKLPVYIYLTALSEKLFGVTEFAVRLVSVLAGIGTVIFTYLLVLELFKNKNLANLSAFLVAVEPWSLFLSRGAFEANLALFFIVAGIYYFITSVQNIKYLLPAVILLGLSVWTYNSARVFVPLLILAAVLIYWKEFTGLFTKNKKIFGINIFLLAVFFIPMFIQLLQPVGQARYGKVSIINDGAIAQIEEERNISKLTPTLNRLVNNRVVYFGKAFVKNWVSHYSASFLFFNGGTDYQFSVPGRGIIYWIDILPITVGLLWLVRKRSKANAFLIAWFLLSPIPSALTNEAPQVLRSIVMLPVPLIVSAIGVLKLAEWIKKRFNISTNTVIATYIVVIYLFLENYGIAYATTYRENYSWSWQYGYKEVISYAKNHYADYDSIIVTKKYGEPHEFFLFYWPWDPEKYGTDPKLIRFMQTDWFWVDRFDKFWFVNDWQIVTNPSHLSSIQETFVTESKNTVDCTKSKCLLITSPENFPPGWRKLDAVNFLDGNPAFEMYDNSK